MEAFSLHKFSCMIGKTVISWEGRTTTNSTSLAIICWLVKICCGPPLSADLSFSNHYVVSCGGPWLPLRSGSVCELLCKLRLIHIGKARKRKTVNRLHFFCYYLLKQSSIHLFTSIKHDVLPNPGLMSDSDRNTSRLRTTRETIKGKPIIN